ncbi:PGA biosynthesis protein CapA-like [Tubulanus polymorphus]|uniref:PGA biosynthesis protein CapA-like n=1 Tax=Tubulanus polymorphus TaxID=672921 RepID=UPI003DA4AD9E
MGHDTLQKAAFNNKTGLYNFDYSFRYMRHILNATDFTIGNLELPIGHKPYTGFPRFSGPAALPRALRDVGFDALSTANNHAFDRKTDGVESTIKTLDSLRIRRSGTFLNERDRKKNSPLILTKRSIQIAILFYTDAYNSFSSFPLPYIVNVLDEAAIERDVSFAAVKNVDQMIAYVHWGKEYQECESSRQTRWLNIFSRLGVNVVVGSHAHVLQPMLWNRDADTFVAFSLGNFYSRQRYRIQWVDGAAVLRISLRKYDSGAVTIDNTEYALTYNYEQMMYLSASLLLVFLGVAAAGELRSTAIAEHDKISAGIEWSNDLAKRAKAHANICGFESSMESYRNDEAENLYMVSEEIAVRNLMRAAVKAWSTKTNNMLKGCPGNAKYCVRSVTKDSWKSASKVGCGVATCDKWLKSYLVCKYE